MALKGSASVILLLSIIVVVVGFGSYYVYTNERAQGHICGNGIPEAGETCATCPVDIPGCIGNGSGNGTTTNEICNNNIDDNNNGLIDCTDSACSADAHCIIVIPPTPEICDNQIDDDQDSYIDCGDTDCKTQARCAKPDLQMKNVQFPTNIKKGVEQTITFTVYNDGGDAKSSYRIILESWKSSICNMATCKGGVREAEMTISSQKGGKSAAIDIKWTPEETGLTWYRLKIDPSTNVERENSSADNNLYMITKEVLAPTLLCEVVVHKSTNKVVIKQSDQCNIVLKDLIKGQMGDIIQLQRNQYTIIGKSVVKFLRAEGLPGYSYGTFNQYVPVFAIDGQEFYSTAIDQLWWGTANLNYSSSFNSFICAIRLPYIQTIELTKSDTTCPIAHTTLVTGAIIEYGSPEHLYGYDIAGQNSTTTTMEVNQYTIIADKVLKLKAIETVGSKYRPVFELAGVEMKASIAGEGETSQFVVA